MTNKMKRRDQRRKRQLDAQSQDKIDFDNWHEAYKKAATTAIYWMLSKFTR